MDIMIRTRFDSVERAEACIKRIRESDCPITEIRLLAPNRQYGDDNIIAVAPSINGVYPGTMGYGAGAYAFRLDTAEGSEVNNRDDDVHNNDSVVEVAAPEESKKRIHSIIINAGGRDTEVF